MAVQINGLMFGSTSGAMDLPLHAYLLARSRPARRSDPPGCAVPMSGRSAAGERFSNFRRIRTRSAGHSWKHGRQARNIFVGLRARPKTLSDFAFGKARLAAISECHLSMAAVDPFRPGRTHHITQRLA